MHPACSDQAIRNCASNRCCVYNALIGSVGETCERHQAEVLQSYSIFMSCSLPATIAAGRPHELREVVRPILISPPAAANSGCRRTNSAKFHPARQFLQTTHQTPRQAIGSAYRRQPNSPPASSHLRLPYRAKNKKFPHNAPNAITSKQRYYPINPPHQKIFTFFLNLFSKAHFSSQS